MWEESPVGTWYLQVINNGPSDVWLKKWSLTLIGTNTHPQLDSADEEPVP